MISVIIPVYNTGESLHTCLYSVLNQSYGELEIICINDGSTDNSLEILYKFAEIDKRITVIDQHNQGVSVARNRGIELASGEFISFIDSDDALDLRMYETLIELFFKDGNYHDIVHCGYRRVRPNGTHADINGTDQIYVHNREDALEHLISGTLFNGGLWNKLFRRTFFNDIRFDPKLKINEDVLVCFQAFSKAKSSIFCDKPLYHYYESPNSTCSTTKLLKKALDSLIVSDIIYNYCSNDARLRSHAAKRLYYTLCSTYRSYIFDNIRNSKYERKALAIKIKTICKQDISISFKHKFNYKFMRYAPMIYRTLYQLYDSIRKPNWDVK